MALDQFKNFAESNLAAGIDDTDTSLDVESGDGALFPSGSFNAVIWNLTDYPNPANDPDKEIVRVTSISTDTLTITRAQEGTSAANHNTGGKTYRIAAPLTAKTLNTDLAKAFAFPMLFPFSAIPVTAGKVFDYVYVGGGSNSKHEAGMGVMASLDGDAIWRLRYALPSVLPPGTPKTRLLALANSAANAAKVNVKWASVALGESPSAATLNAEGVGTITWSTGDADKYKSLDVTLDADTPVAGEILVMDLTFETSSWTLAVPSCWQAPLIWVP